MSSSEDECNDSGQEQEEEYEVERIEKKRIRNGVIEYFIKWIGYAESDNTWEPRDNLSCDEIINNFEKAEKEREAKKAGGSTPLPKNKEEKRKSEVAPAASSQKKKKPEPEEEEKGFERGLEPEKVIGATDSSGELMFLLKWKDSEEADLVPAKIANEKCPQVVIAFYEERLTWHSKITNEENNDD